MKKRHTHRETQRKTETERQIEREGVEKDRQMEREKSRKARERMAKENERERPPFVPLLLGQVSKCQGMGKDYHNDKVAARFDHEQSPAYLCMHLSILH